TSLMYVINPKLNDSFSDLDVLPFAGEECIWEEMEGLKYKIGPKSFYQTNSRQALCLYEQVRALADLKGDELVYDLYTGTGTIASFVSRNAKKVIGIEYVPEAIEDARTNMAVNGLTNMEFFAGDMKDILTDDFVAEHGHPDLLITDPPRAGMHPDVVSTILRTAPKRIVYVSCNPATQARDVELMAEQYKVIVTQPVDMFPHTSHVENILLLDRK
ncbi:MAG: 23S rRNA (uracil(1939)-C(5))-methyltransferase RlmD, partial [Bacteroidales bacterium]|uniref:23S rRNA (uracil(1939)-C(5))-methyltransferase RlmD n=1 Tax=Porphyromonas sp. TaxID=1924944 RepID=UPI002973D1E1